MVEKLFPGKEVYCFFFIVFNSQSSEEHNACYGVPQGSLLWPLLFIVYLNELASCVKYCSVDMYADVTTIGQMVHHSLPEN